MKTVTISGIQGSGKTTLIRDLITEVDRLGKTTGVVLNENGEEIYDEEFLKKHGTIFRSLRGG